MAFNAADHMIKMQGRDYLPVAARVLWMRQDHPAWSIITEPAPIGNAAYMRATIMDDGGRVLATAHKAVRADARGAVGQYPVEAAETGAVGRALGLCGYGTLAGDLGDDVVSDQLSDAPTAPRQTNGHAGANGTAAKPAAPPAPEFHATPLIEAMTSAADLAGVMRAIQTGYADNPHARGNAWVKALLAASDLCHTADDLAAVSTAYGKARGKLTAEQKAAVEADLEEARVVVNEIALAVPEVAG